MKYLLPFSGSAGIAIGKLNNPDHYPTLKKYKVNTVIYDGEIAFGNFRIYRQIF
jgi:hypothetical protein